MLFIRIVGLLLIICLTTHNKHSLKYCWHKQRSEILKIQQWNKVTYTVISIIAWYIFLLKYLIVQSVDYSIISNMSYIFTPVMPEKTCIYGFSNVFLI
jgi:hypothetical protein